jgi:hypothetical protein
MAEGRLARWDYRRATRVISHTVIWTSVLIPTLVQATDGWRPLGDDATIATRSYQILSSHPPLLGQFSTISSGAGHILFDPGPLQYALLAIPVHLDHGQGALWGAAFIWGAVLSLAVEAVWSTGRWFGCAAVAFCVVDVAYLIPNVFGHLLWNPFMGLPFVIASLALGWTVSLGSFKWWPVLIVTASAAAQSELIFAGVVVAVAVVSPLIGRGLWGRPERWGWLVTGIVVGVLCWLAPVIQQFTGHPGNFSSLLSVQGKERAIGLQHGLGDLAFTVWPRPIWMSPHNFLGSLHAAFISPPLGGLLVLAAMAASTFFAWKSGRKDLAGLASIGLLSSVAVIVTYSSVPAAHLYNLWYLIFELWIVGLLLWIVLLWAVFEVARSLAAHRSWGRRWSERHHSLTSGPMRIPTAAVVALSALLVVWVLALTQVPSNALAPAAKIRQMQQVARSIERQVPRGPVTIDFVIHQSGHYGYVDLEGTLLSQGSGVAWQLTGDHWHPIMPAEFTKTTGITYDPQPAAPIATIIVAGDQIALLSVSGAHPEKHPS